MKKILSTTLKLGFVLVLIGACFYAYQENEKITERNNATIEDQTLITDYGLEVELIGDNTLKEKEVNNFLKELEDIPEDLRGNCSKVIFTNKEINEIDPDADPDIGGLASSSGLIIFHNSANRMTVLHEMMHLHDFFTRGDGYVLSDNDAEFQQLANNLIQKGSAKISTLSTREVYADAGAYFIGQDPILQNESKELYDYFNTKIFPNRFQ